MQADYARNYRRLWERHWWWRSRESLVLAWIERLDRRSPCRRILDVGCGDGLFFDRLERFGEVRGLEPDASLVRDPLRGPRIECRALGGSFRGSGDFDLVLLLDVLEHIGDDVGALAAARSALKPGGRLLLTVPALGWLWSRHDEVNEHHRRYEPRALRGVFEAAGFEVETVRYFFFWTVAPLLARRWLAPGGPGAGTADYAVAIPPPPVNGLLRRLSALDHAAGRFVRWPLGSSLLAVARNPDPAGTTGTSVPRSSRLFGRRAVALARNPRRMGRSADLRVPPLSEPVTP